MAVAGSIGSGDGRVAELRDVACQAKGDFRRAVPARRLSWFLSPPAGGRHERVRAPLPVTSSHQHSTPVSSRRQKKASIRVISTAGCTVEGAREPMWLPTAVGAHQRRGSLGGLDPHELGARAASCHFHFGNGLLDSYPLSLKSKRDGLLTLTAHGATNGNRAGMRCVRRRKDIGLTNAVPATMSLLRYQIVIGYPIAIH